VFRGETLEVDDLEEGWLVRLGDREVREYRLDHALEKLLGLPRGDVLELMREIVEFRRESATHALRRHA
jgi:hypothetical protein